MNELETIFVIIGLFLSFLAGLPALLFVIRKVLEDYEKALEDGEIDMEEFLLLVRGLLSIFKVLSEMISRIKKR